jgi:hypothetical protein
LSGIDGFWADSFDGDFGEADSDRAADLILMKRGTRWHLVPQIFIDGDSVRGIFMRISILEAARQWLTTLHEDLVKSREETAALREDLRHLTALVEQTHGEILQMRKDLERLNNISPAEDDEQEPRWKM